MCYVYRSGQDILYKDELTMKEQAEFKDNLLETVFKNGKLIKLFLREIKIDYEIFNENILSRFEF